jgi:uncharacterized protein involved in response to NO
MNASPTVRPGAAWPLPYRVLFPIGLANSILAAILWPLHAMGLVAWPGIAHQILMILGFEQCFVFGFLLTAMPAFTGGPPCRPLELVVPVAAVLGIDGLVLAGFMPGAFAAWLVGIVSLLVALVRRVARAPARPPAEFLFAALAMVLGLVGGVLLLGSSTGWWIEPQPRFGIRLVSLGFVLPLVLGLGALLVPTFSGMRDPMKIPGLARAHQRGPRFALYLPLAIALAAAFVAEALGHPAWGAWLRAAAAAAILLLSWKVWRPPGRGDVPALCLWGSGWMTLAGLLLAAAWPNHALAGEHTVFIGGFGLLTLGIATRVIVSHGGHPLALEARALGPGIAVAVLVALALRLAAEAIPARMVPLLGWSGAAWVIAWAWWGAGVLGLIVKRARS